MNSLSRISAILIKELIQMGRDRMTFAMMLGIPLMQLVLFGFAINTNPKHLPTAIYSEEQSTITRSIIKGLENSSYFSITATPTSAKQAELMLAQGKVSFVVHIPTGFTQHLLKGLRPQLLVEADATDPSASSNAVANLQQIIQSALQHDLKGPFASIDQSKTAVDLVIHRKYNPEGITQYNIVPGLLGVILTMTSVMFTSMAMTRESERGNLENLLAMPTKSYEVMIGKISPYVLVGFVQTVIIMLAAKYLFAVPFYGSLAILLAGVLLFIIANLALGFTFSTFAASQMQAMQMTFFFFLPSLLLSGFMFPFKGMPDWAQFIGEVFPLTHFLRIVRGIMLKGLSITELTAEFQALLLFTAVATVIAILRYKKTLD
jgi:ABC-2 type transport system permease protein